MNDSNFPSYDLSELQFIKQLTQDCIINDLKGKICTKPNHFKSLNIIMRVMKKISKDSSWYQELKANGWIISKERTKIEIRNYMFGEKFTYFTYYVKQNYLFVDVGKTCGEYYYQAKFDNGFLVDEDILINGKGIISKCKKTPQNERKIVDKYYVLYKIDKLEQPMNHGYKKLHWSSLEFHWKGVKLL